MTRAQTIAAIRALGASVSVDAGEWRITVGTCTYYTNDRKDALETAREMVKKEA